MKRLWRNLGLVLLTLALMMNGSGNVAAQTPTTTVQDTVYRADGTPAGGQVIVSWNAFTTANGTVVPAGTTSATIGAGGLLSIALAPNAGSTPMGSYYTAVFHLNDGTTSREFWVVPAAVPGGGPAKLAAISNQVLPVSVAMQTVSKQYVDNAIAAAADGFPLDSSPYVLKAGDTMTGPLVLPADPVSPLQAADKNYVDTNISSFTAGLAGKVALLPSATQVVTQPAGTQLETNLLNGELYATQYLDGSGHNGLANALASPDCASGCTVVAEPTYPGVEHLNLFSATTQDTHEVDKRGGAEVHVMVDPLPPSGNGVAAAETIESLSTRSDQAYSEATGSATGLGTSALVLQHSAVTGGSNQFPNNVETPPYFKADYNVLTLNGNYNTLGQHNTTQTVTNCFSVGDCIDSTRFVTASGGFRDLSDEGTHLSDEILSEDGRVFTGVCGTGCTTGSTMLTLTSMGAGGTQGDGRYLIDTNPAKVLSTGILTGGDRTIFGTATFSGTSFPVSVFLSTAAAATSQPHNLAPGTVTLPIATSGVTSGFATNTAALPTTSGIACVADPSVGGQEFPNIEMAPYTVMDATHVQLTLAKVHQSGATIAVGGLCGYGLEQKVDTVGGLRQVFPVVGSTSPTGLYYADGATPIVGNIRSSSTGAYLNVQLPVASIARSGNIVTLTTASNLSQDLNGLTLTVSGVADPSYNGSYVVTTTAVNVVTYANSGPDSTSSGGTLGMVTGSFALYPMAEVLNVYNSTTRQIDGTMRLGPNTVGWANGDTVEEPHYYQQQNYADVGLIGQTLPRPVTFTTSGRTYTGTVGPGLRGWEVGNGAPASQYFSNGGTHNLPDAALVVFGPWDRSLDVEAGATAVLDIHCNLHGCNRWNSGYSLLRMDAAVGADSLNYAPQSSTASWVLHGTVYSFSPTAFTAGTINVGTLNATTITGGVSAGAITSGTIAPARLPVFGPSGTTHTVGAVPDPGAIAGSSRYLREDGTWSVPAGGGGSSTGAAGGDLSGTYPNPTVAAVHATSGFARGLTDVSTGTNMVQSATTLSNTTLSAAALSTDTTLTLTSAPGVANGINTVDIGSNEFVQCTGLSGTTLTGCTRGMYGSAASAHASGSTVVLSQMVVAASAMASPSFWIVPGKTIFLNGSGFGAGSINATSAQGLFTGVVQAFTVSAASGTGGFQAPLYTPASSSAACTAGTTAADAGFVYVCTSTNTWKRTSLSTF